MSTQKTSILGQDFELHPCGAVYWVTQKMLLIADVHLGKVSHFRKYGIAIPPESIAGNFEKLNQVIANYDPEVICFLGDLFHSESNHEFKMFAQWLCDLNRRVVLVIGNHDTAGYDDYCDYLEVMPSWQIGEVLLTHHPQTDCDNLNICGHIHPCILLRGTGRQALRLPCFYYADNQFVLPAFGLFTGMYEMPIDRATRVFAIADKEVVVIS